VQKITEQHSHECYLGGGLVNGKQALYRMTNLLKNKPSNCTLNSEYLSLAQMTPHHYAWQNAHTLGKNHVVVLQLVYPDLACCFAWDI